MTLRVVANRFITVHEAASAKNVHGPPPPREQGGEGPWTICGNDPLTKSAGYSESNKTRGLNR